MQLYKDLPINKKLILFTLSISVLALIVSAAAVLYIQGKEVKQSMVDQLTVLASALAKNSSAALEFLDPQSGQQTLQALTAENDIVRGILYTNNGEKFAGYNKQQNNSGRDRNSDKNLLGNFKEGYRFIDIDGVGYLDVIYPVEIHGDRIGSLFVRSNMDKLEKWRTNYIHVLLAIFFVVALLIIFLSSRFQHLITGPLSNLADTAREITHNNDYSIRVESSSKDEVGELVKDFNTMLKTIHHRDEALKDNQQHLENLVVERTSELVKKRDEALASAKVKSEFLANMSHEIRTPMNGIIGMLGLLKEHPMPAEQFNLLETAVNSSDSLLRIINDILDFSKIEAGKLEFEIINFNLRDLVEETLSLFSETADKKQIELVCFIPIGMPYKIKGDPTRLRQVISNLISNALKFTNEGEVSIRVCMLEKIDQQVTLQFVVSDTGIGIPEKMQATLFEAFTQADSSTTRKYGGTGLGLSISKQLVNIMQGEISLQSELGVGSKFEFSCKFDLSDKQTSQPINCLTLKGKSALIVDDNATNRQFLELYLTSIGMHYVSCASGQEALKKLEMNHQDNGSYDIALLDYHMPEMDGIELARRIHMDSRYTDLKIFMLSSVSSSQQALKDAGILSNLMKPIQTDKLYQELVNILVGTQSQTTKNIPLNELPRYEGKVLIVDDEPINYTVLQAMLKKLDLEESYAANGQEAVEMANNHTFDLIFMDCHMPVLNGFDATRKIRIQERTQSKPRTPIVAMTANAMTGVKKQCIDAGMDDYLTKPIRHQFLANYLEKWFTKKTCQDISSDADITDVTVNKVVEASNTVWNREQALEFAGGDQVFLRELIEIYLERSPQLLSAIEQSIKNMSAHALQETAHAYKGMVGHFCAQELKDLSLKLEIMGREEQLDQIDEVFAELQLQSNALRKILLSEVEQEGNGNNHSHSDHEHAYKV